MAVKFQYNPITFSEQGKGSLQIETEGKYFELFVTIAVSDCCYSTLTFLLNLTNLFVPLSLYLESFHRVDVVNLIVFYIMDFWISVLEAQIPIHVICVLISNMIFML
jgi:hypothetical protein